MKVLSKSEIAQNATEEEEYLQDFPPGPLDVYRKQATFNWKTMKLTMESESVLKFKVSQDY